MFQQPPFRSASTGHDYYSFALTTVWKRNLPIHILRQIHSHIRRVNNFNITCNPWNYYSIHLPSTNHHHGETPDFQPKKVGDLTGAPRPESQESGAIVARFVLHLVVVDLSRSVTGGKWEDGTHTKQEKDDKVGGKKNTSINLRWKFRV